MPPIRLNRRHFLGYSAAAGWALSQSAGAGTVSEVPVRVGMVGLGSRGTQLLRSLLELPKAEVVAVCDAEARHCQRAQGIAEKAGKPRPQECGSIEEVFDRGDLDAVVIAIPNDLHASAYLKALQAGKHVYAEKPLGLSLVECDRLIEEAGSRPDQVFHTGLQRRSNPRFQDAAELVRRGELGELLCFRGHWISSNGPVSGHDGWLARRERSGDWMVEQAIHIWDILNWFAGSPPVSAAGYGRRDVFKSVQPDRDVTDHYSVMLHWPEGLHATFTHSWVDPADNAFTGNSLQLVGSEGGLDLQTGVATFRERGKPRLPLHAGTINDTRLALAAFLDAVGCAGDVPAPPISLAEAREAVLTSLLVREAVDRDMKRLVTLDEVRE